MWTVQRGPHTATNCCCCCSKFITHDAHSYVHRRINRIDLMMWKASSSGRSPFAAARFIGSRVILMEAGHLSSVERPKLIGPSGFFATETPRNGLATVLLPGLWGSLTDRSIHQRSINAWAQQRVDDQLYSYFVSMYVITDTHARTPTE